MEIHFAPLQGYTDYVFRNAHSHVYGNIDRYYSPFVRLESSDTFRNKDLRDIDPSNNDSSVFVPQILAGSADEACKIIDMLRERNYTKADINMGCPFPLVTRKRKGAGILPFPDMVSDLLSVTERCPGMDFSVKMRIGMEDADECLRLADIINGARISHVTVHPRLGKQQYKGTPDMDAFARFASVCTQPLIYNGDIHTVEDIVRIETEFPNLKGVMIGRGMLANPALALEYRSGEILSDERRRALLARFHDEIFAEQSGRLQGDTQLLSHLQPLWEYLYPELDRKLRKRILRASKVDAYLGAVREAIG